MEPRRDTVKNEEFQVHVCMLRSLVSKATTPTIQLFYFRYYFKNTGSHVACIDLKEKARRLEKRTACWYQILIGQLRVKCEYDWLKPAGCAGFLK